MKTPGNSRPFEPTRQLLNHIDENAIHPHQRVSNIKTQIHDIQGIKIGLETDMLNLEINRSSAPSLQEITRTPSLYINYTGDSKEDIDKKIEMIKSSLRKQRVRESQLLAELKHLEKIIPPVDSHN
jgi:hypothetical protein